MEVYAKIFDVTELHCPPLTNMEVYQGLTEWLIQATCEVIEEQPELAGRHIWMVITKDSFEK